jgi:hypothetical protein
LWELIVPPCRCLAKELQALIAERPASANDYRLLFFNRHGSAMTRFGLCSIIRKFRDRSAETIPSLKTKQESDIPHTSPYDRHAPAPVGGGNQCAPQMRFLVDPL